MISNIIMAIIILAGLVGILLIVTLSWEAPIEPSKRDEEQERIERFQKEIKRIFESIEKGK